MSVCRKHRSSCNALKEPFFVIFALADQDKQFNELQVLLLYFTMCFMLID